MPAIALDLGRFPNAFAVRAAVIASFFRPAIAGGVGTLLIVGHKILLALDSGIGKTMTFGFSKFLNFLREPAFLPNKLPGLQRLHRIR